MQGDVEFIAAHLSTVTCFRSNVSDTLPFRFLDGFIGVKICFLGTGMLLLLTAFDGSGNWVCTFGLWVRHAGT